MTTRLKPEPLTREAFAPFGDVIETRDSRRFTINGGHAVRFHDLARIDVAAEAGRPLLNIFRSQPRPSPLRLTVMDRHPLASWLIVVAAGPDPC